MVELMLIEGKAVVSRPVGARGRDGFLDLCVMGNPSQSGSMREHLNSSKVSSKLAFHRTDLIRILGAPGICSGCRTRHLPLALPIR